MPFLSYARALELRRQLQGTRAEVICIGCDDYATSIRRWSDTCEKEAGAVVRVASTAEVAEVVRFCRKNHIDFVVEAGGHSTTGASSSHGGVVISLAKMRKVLTDPASETVCVQGGATWDMVNDSTAPYGLAVVGAMTSHAGVGGSTLGGGSGWLTGQYGLISDQLVGVKVVLADGTIVEASNEDNQDLFWAMRGAGQAFGIATEFVFRAHKVRDEFFGGVIEYDVDRLPMLVNFANESDRRQDPNSGFYFGFAYSRVEKQMVLRAVVFYDGSAYQGGIFFGPILYQNPLISPLTNHTGMRTYVEMNAFANVDPVPEGRKSISGANIMRPLETSLLQDLYSQFVEGLNAYPRMEDSVLMFDILPYKRTVEVPVDETACANRGPYCSARLLLCWHDSELDAKMHALQRSIISKILEAQRGIPDDHGVACPNLAGHDVSAEKLFGPNLPRLQKLKRKYDPHNVFRKWHDLLAPAKSHVEHTDKS